MTTPGNSSITESENLTLASCTVDYFDVINSRPVQHRVECTIVLNPNTSSPVTSDCVDDIEQHRLRCEVADALGQANKMADRGNFTGARGVLKKATGHVRGSRVNYRALPLHLLGTLQESLDGMQDRETYVKHGKSILHNYAGSHWQQRSNSTPSQEGYVKRSKLLKPPAPSPLQIQSEPTAGATEGRPSPPLSVASDSSSPYRNSHKMRLMAHYAKK